MPSAGCDPLPHLTFNRRRPAMPSGECDSPFSDRRGHRHRLTLEPWAGTAATARARPERRSRGSS